MEQSKKREMYMRETFAAHDKSHRANKVAIHDKG